MASHAQSETGWRQKADWTPTAGRQPQTDWSAYAEAYDLAMEQFPDDYQAYQREHGYEVEL